MKTKTEISLLICLFLVSLTQVLQAQKSGGLINLHVNCNRCDMNYIRQEIPYVNHVRDQGLADVQAFINRIRSGNGGSVYELSFTGKNDFEGLKQELVFESNPNQTRDEIREGLLKRIEAGLLPYLLQTGKQDKVLIQVEHEETTEEEPQEVTLDPWKYWIFEVRGEGNLEKESQRNSFDLEFGIEADHVTEDWKIRGDIEFNISESRFNSDEEEFISVRNRHFFDGGVIRSLGGHWSAGLFGGVSHNTFNNIDFSYYASPAVEFSIYPYREAIRRELTLVYRVSFTKNNYIEETIYGKKNEGLMRQVVGLRSRFRQPWGDLFASLEASSFLHDFSKNRLELDGFINIRLFQGFSLRVNTEIQFIRDLITLPAGESSLEDILLRQRQIATDFTMEFGIGVAYTFGSAFNSIVNTRL